MFGESLLAAPVVSPINGSTGLASEAVWLPEGNWVEWPTGRHLHGPLTLTRNFSIQQIPIYVHEGAILPMAPPMERTGQKPVDPLIVTVFPLADGASSNYTLYQDAGNTRSYQEDQAARTPLSAEEKGSDLTVTIGPETGSYPGMEEQRAYELKLPGDWPPASVTANGASIPYNTHEGATGWHYEGNTLTTVVALPRASVDQPVTIVVHRDPALLARRAELDGYAGAMTRLREAYDVLNQTWPLSWSPDDLIDAMQSGDRLTYTPQAASQELSHFQQVLTQARAEVHQAAQGLPPEEQKALETSKNHPLNNQSGQKMMADYKMRTAKADALVSDIQVGEQVGQQAGHKD
jgi:alpha-glucosidase